MTHCLPQSAADEVQHGDITNGEVNISHETTTMVVWIYDGV